LADFLVLHKRRETLYPFRESLDISIVNKLAQLIWKRVVLMRDVGLLEPSRQQLGDNKMNNEEIELGSDSDDDQVDQQGDVQQQQTDGMTPAQRKLFELRLKMVSFFFQKLFHYYYSTPHLSIIVLLCYVCSLLSIWSLCCRMRREKRIIRK
jgi:hypothetical protein